MNCHISWSCRLRRAAAAPRAPGRSVYIYKKRLYCFLEAPFPRKSCFISQGFFFWKCTRVPRVVAGGPGTRLHSDLPSVLPHASSLSEEGTSPATCPFLGFGSWRFSILLPHPLPPPTAWQPTRHVSVCGNSWHFLKLSVPSWVILRFPNKLTHTSEIMVGWEGRTLQSFPQEVPLYCHFEPHEKPLYNVFYIGTHSTLLTF